MPIVFAALFGPPDVGRHYSIAGEWLRDYYYGMKQLLLTDSYGAEETEAIAEELSVVLKPGDVIALYGTLGAGKTCFVRGLARGLKVSMPVKSPTFSIINEYPGSVPLYHIDFYRLENRSEITDLGWTDYMGSDGIVVIEWADRVKNMLPVNRFDIYLSIHGDTIRRIEILANVDTGNR